MVAAPIYSVDVFYCLHRTPHIKTFNASTSYTPIRSGCVEFINIYAILYYSLKISNNENPTCTNRCVYVSHNNLYISFQSHITQLHTKRSQIHIHGKRCINNNGHKFLLSSNPIQQIITNPYIYIWIQFTSPTIHMYVYIYTVVCISFVFN